MENKEIKNLLEKFYEGKTSLSEEILLKDFFGQNDVPLEFDTDRKVFMLFLDSSNNEMLDDGFDDEIMEMIHNQDKQTKGERRILYLLSGIAAGFAILLGTYLFVLENRITLGHESAFELAAINDPEIALEETRKALYLVSEVFSKGMSDLANISKFDQATQDLQSLGKFHDIEQLITNKK